MSNLSSSHRSARAVKLSPSEARKAAPEHKLTRGQRDPRQETTRKVKRAQSCSPAMHAQARHLCFLTQKSDIPDSWHLVVEGAQGGKYSRPSL